jgi:N-acylglucosamine 2-epimerase
MERRNFLTALTGHLLALLAAPRLWAIGEGRRGNQYGVSAKSAKRISRIGKRSLEDIRDVFKKELYEKTIPLWKEKGVDWEHGGYLPHIDEKGDFETTNKKLYYQGRMLWLFSYFYNRFDKDGFHLRAAKNGYDFLTKYCVDDRYDWFTEVTREGRPVTKYYDIYASIFTILGLTEFYRATKIEESRDLAVKSAYRATEVILSPTFQGPGHGRTYEPGVKRLGTWLHLLSTLTPLLKYTADDGLEKIARMCCRHILERHWQPDLGLAYEVLQPDFTPYPKDYFIDEETRTKQNSERWVNNFHTMEAGWMVMDEALRTGNREMFRKAMAFGRSHLDRCWVVRGKDQGLVQFFMPDYPESFEKGGIIKPYIFKEVFILLLLAIEHSGETWAVDWFDRAFSYAYETPLEWPYRDTLHHPRGIMFSLEILDRMIKRDGRLSDFLD